MALEAAQPDAADELPGSLGRRARAEQNVLLHGKPWEERIGLEHHAAIGAGVPHRLAIEQHAASGGALEPGDDAKERRFAAARWSEDGDEVVVFHCEVRARERHCRRPAPHARELMRDAVDQKAHG